MQTNGIFIYFNCLIYRTAVRFKKYDENRQICGHGNENCARYQEFGIEDIMVHSQFNFSWDFNIALVRLKTRIQFGRGVQPICLPFGDNRISKPDESIQLISYGTTLISQEAKKVFVQQRCKGNRTTICLKRQNRTKIIRNLGPLMYGFQFNLKFDRMVLEGVSSDDNIIDRHLIFTNVREFGDWLDHNMKM